MQVHRLASIPACQCLGPIPMILFSPHINFVSDLASEMVRPAHSVREGSSTVPSSRKIIPPTKFITRRVKSVTGDHFSEDNGMFRITVQTIYSPPTLFQLRTSSISTTEVQLMSTTSTSSLVRLTFQNIRLYEVPLTESWNRNTARRAQNLSSSNRPLFRSSPIGRSYQVNN